MTDYCSAVYELVIWLCIFGHLVIIIVLLLYLFIFLNC